MFLKVQRIERDKKDLAIVVGTSVYDCKSFTFFCSESKTGEKLYHMVLEFSNGTDRVIDFELDKVIIFVMNGQGRTVETYTEKSIERACSLKGV